ncbi:MAG TPA: BamA/TamA family outer membrane protein [Polyangia bacterium]
MSVRGGAGGPWLPVTLLLASTGVVGCATGQGGERQPVVEKLDVKGNHVVSDSQIEEKILTTPTGWWPFAKKSFFDPVVWATDLERIKRLYGSLGYYQAEIVRDHVTPRPPDGVALEVEVREGDVTRISSVDVTGVDDLPAADRTALMDALDLRAEAPFQEGRWAAAKTRMRDRLRERGYAEAEVEGAALIDVATKTARLTLAVRPGELFRFGAIEVDTGGEGSIAPVWIWDQVRLAIPEGELYSTEALVEAQRRVANMGVFGAVKVTTVAPDRATHRIAVHVETREAPLHTLKLGGGVRIDQIRNEARLIGEWTNRNFLGGMRRLNLHVEVGWAFIPNTYSVVTNDQSTQVRNGLISRLRLEFEQPRFLGRPSLSERSSVELVRTLEQTYDDLGGRVSNGVVWRPRASLTIYPSHHLQGDQLNGPAGSAALTAPLTLGCKTANDSCFVWLSYLEEVVTWDRRDDALEPRHGWYASLSLQQGGGPLLGDFSYYRILPEVRGYASFGEGDELTIAGRVRMGELVPSSGNAQDSAVVTRFYAGGAQSMRGFNDRRLSPLLVTQLPSYPGNPNPTKVTLPIGGDGLIDGSLEVRYRVTSNLVVAAFLDFGQVTMGPLHADDIPHVLVAVGLGLRYLTPVGPVRVDFGRRLQVGRPPLLFAVTDKGLEEQKYKVDDSCFGLGGTGRDVVDDNLCVLHISIGEAF